MSFIDVLKEGKIPQNKPKSVSLTPYDVYMAKKRPYALSGGLNAQHCRIKGYRDAEAVVGMLKTGKGVLVELDGENLVCAQRILDFLSGAVYAVGGKMERTARGKYLFTPQGMTIVSDGTKFPT